jgi:uncharacterized transporter YbjL
MFFNRLLLIFFTLFSTVLQANPEVEMADIMRSSGKIYVVVAVLVIIFSGIVIWLIRLERKIRQLELENTTNS